MKNNQIESIKNENNDCKSFCQKLCIGIPLFVKLLILITILFYVLNLLFSSLSFYVSNIPYYTIKKYQIWRLFSTSLMTTSIINVIFAILFWIKHASNLEDIMGTIIYLIIFIMNSTIIQIIFSFLFLIISLIIKNEDLLKSKINSKGKVTNAGIWPYIICELTLLSLSNPNHPIKFLFFPEFKAKYYPILVFIFFCIPNNLSTDFEILSGIIYAFIYHFVIKKKLKFSNSLILKIENLACIKCFKILGGFVSVNKNNKYSSNNNQLGRRAREVIVNQNMKGFVAFQGERSIPGDSLREIKSDQNIPTQNQKEQNETLDVKIQ